MFNLKKPTVQLLGSWQPWQEEHTELFKEAIQTTGQVCLQIRDVHGIDDNQFEFHTISSDIQWALKQEGYEHHIHYIIMQVPNVVDVVLENEEEG